MWKFFYGFLLKLINIIEILYRNILHETRAYIYKNRYKTDINDLLYNNRLPKAIYLEYVLHNKFYTLSQTMFYVLWRNKNCENFTKSEDKRELKYRGCLETNSKLVS